MLEDLKTYTSCVIVNVGNRMVLIAQKHQACTPLRRLNAIRLGLAVRPVTR